MHDRALYGLGALPFQKYADKAKMATIIAIMMMASICYAQQIIDQFRLIMAHI